MAKFKVEAKFYCYIDESGMQKHVLKKADLETEETPEEETDQEELDLVAEGEETGFSIGTVFAASFPDRQVTYNYFWIALDHADGFIARSAEDGSNHVLTAEHIKEKIDSGEYSVSTKKMYNVMAKHKGTAEIEDDAEDLADLDETQEAEAPVTADGTTVEEEVNKAIKELVGHLDQPLVMSGNANGIWSNKVLDGDVEICKDEAHDLLNAESDGLRAVFVVTLKDKK